MKNSYRFFVILAVVTGVSFGSNPAQSSDFSFNFATISGMTENLFDDSSYTFDVYETSTIKTYYYPLSSLEFGLVGEQTAYYWDQISLSNVIGGIEGRFIPLPRTSQWAFSVYGKFSGIRYHDDFNGFDNNVGKVEIAGGYDFNPSLSVRGGFSFSSTSYISLDIAHKEDVEYFWGGNVTLPGDIGFDIEGGLARANYQYIDLTGDISNPDVGLSKPASHLNGQGLKVLYLSPRISRLIAPKTGLNVLFTNRNFQNYGGQLIFGFSTSFLSPWASVWEGQAVSANLKSYLVPQFIITAGAGYWDKSFLRTIEEDYQFYVALVMDEPNIERRQDWQTKYYFSVQWPISSRSGVFFEPSMRIDYTKNYSTEPLYTYRDYSFSMMLTLRI